MNDSNYLKLAIENSVKSMQDGNFPAGAIVVKDNTILSSEVSSPYPGLFHADSKAIMEAFKKNGALQGATLYIGLESCLMCTSICYWAGLRRIVYAVPKSKVSKSYYETAVDSREIIQTFHEPITFLHLQELEVNALAVIKEWEKKST